MTAEDIDAWIDELFSEDCLQPGMVIEYKDVLWRFKPEWKNDMKSTIKSKLIEARQEGLRRTLEIVGDDEPGDVK